MKDLAVLITVYNDQKPLETALDSIREPDNSFTVVIVDDGSQPAFALDPDRYPFRIVLIRREKNQGVIAAANAGLEYIRAGGFTCLARLDAGDLNRPNRFSIQYERLENSTDLAMVGSNALYRDEITGENLFLTDLPRTTREIRKWNVFRTCFIQPTVMIRLDRIDDTLRYDPQYRHIEDYVLYSRIARAYPTANIAEPLVECFVREGGISRSNDTAQLLSGVRHHLDHPEPLNLLWHAYVFKRLLYLLVPYPLRNRIKNVLRFIKSSPVRVADVSQSC